METEDRRLQHDLLRWTGRREGGIARSSQVRYSPSQVHMEEVGREFVYYKTNRGNIKVDQVVSKLPKHDGV